MTAVKDSFLNLEKHRQQLEEHVEQLTIALEEWRQWEEEYETLRADVKTQPAQATGRDLSRAREGFQGDLIKEKELVEIFGRDDSRKRDQIMSTLTNRLDYVSRNIDTLSKQLEAAQNKFAAATVVSNPDAADEDGLPITEIMEELDDDDNVVSYSLRRPGDNEPQLLEVLDKAGIKDLWPKPAAAAPANSELEEERGTNGDPPDQTTKPEYVTTRDSQTEKAVTKKSVTFSEDTKPGEDSIRPLDPTQRMEKIMRQAKEQEELVSDPVIPADDSPEEADLREQMIRYNRESMLYEMGPIVAELQLEEGSTDEEIDSEEFDEDEDVDGDEEEDQWGRSTSGVIDEKWKRQMLELKERLSSHVFGEEKATEDESNSDTGDGIGRIMIRPTEADTTRKDVETRPIINSKVDAPLGSSDTQKRVRFAPSLDATETPDALPESTRPEWKQTISEVDPLSDVLERMPGTTKTAPISSKKKPSRFKMSKANEPSAISQAPRIILEMPVDHSKYAPSGPEGRTLAPSILEREPSTEAAAPDELDASLLHQQVAGEYFKMRNKFVHRQGGYLREDENPIQPLDEEEGGPIRMSKFKAARLARS